MRRIYEQIQTVEDMSLLNGVAFEEFLADVFRGFGYEVDTTPKSGDYGADLIMMRDGKKVVAQAKQYAGTVGFDAVKEVHFAKDFYGADEAWVIATHGFTPQAITAAGSTGVRLVSGAEIVRMLEEDAVCSTPRDSGCKSNLELESEDRPDSPLFTVSGQFGENLLQYHGRERNVVIPSDLEIWYIGPHAFSDPGAYADWPEGFVDPVCDWSEIQSVVVPEGVIEIGRSAFKGCRSLRSISLPSTLERIDSSAFEDCVSLREVVLPQGIKTIGSNAFAGCRRLGTLVLPPSVSAVEVGHGAFRGSGVKSLTIRGNYQLETGCFESCSDLECVDIGSIQVDRGDASASTVSEVGLSESVIGMEALPWAAFKLCRSLKEVRLPDTLVSIGALAFAKCYALQTVAIPVGVTELGDMAFFECSSLSSIRIPPRVEVVRGEAFARCSMLSEVLLSDGVRSIEEKAFFACGRMRRIALPESVEDVASRAFASCNALADVTLSPNVRSIKAETFDRCTALANVTLPEGLEVIEGHAFKGCTRLRRVLLPASVNNVAPHAFEGCEALEVVRPSPGCSGTFFRSAFLGCPLMEVDEPIWDLPGTATLVNDARFPSMFEGPSHELQALKFDTYDYKLYPLERIKGFRIVDPGVEGLNSFSSDSEVVDGVDFMVKLNDGCDRGYYSVKGSHSFSEQEAISDGYLEPKVNEYSSLDPSQCELGAMKGHFSVYLYNCHLIVSPSTDGALAVDVLDAYRDKVMPLVEEYERIEADEKTPNYKPAALDRLHVEIRAANTEFENEARKAGLDYEYYVRKYSKSLGRGYTSSEIRAKARSSEMQALSASFDSVFVPLAFCIISILLFLKMMGFWS